MAGFTPMTLTGRLPALISAPSKAIVFLTPVILFSRLRFWPVIPLGATTSRSGKMICRNDPASRLAAAADRAAAVNDPPAGGWIKLAVAPTAKKTKALQPATPRSAGVSELMTVARGPLRRIRRLIAVKP